MEKHKIVSALATMFAATGLFAACCHRTAPVDTAVPAAPQKLVPATVVDLHDLDGCAFLLELKDGKRLEPGMLPAPYRHGGRKVMIRYHVVKRQSICMAGTAVEIDHIEFSEVR